mmetsp:Transcript_12469/g.14489  ORF Transcript_12469/g.14489 Transcript_12469/m.14489 type:complete len:88 (+) Transcript_12469:140-403(+)
MNPGDLLEATEEGDVQRVVDILSQLINEEEEPNVETAELLDDVDSDGKTSLMAAARGVLAAVTRTMPPYWSFYGRVMIRNEAQQRSA